MASLPISQRSHLPATFWAGRYIYTKSSIQQFEPIYIFGCQHILRFELNLTGILNLMPRTILLRELNSQIYNNLASRLTMRRVSLALSKIRLLRGLISSTLVGSLSMIIPHSPQSEALTLSFQANPSWF